MIAVHLVTVSQMMWFLSLKGINKNNKRKRNPHSGSTSQPRPYVYPFHSLMIPLFIEIFFQVKGKKKYHGNLLIFEMCDWDNGTIPWWQDRWLDIFFDQFDWLNEHIEMVTWLQASLSRPVLITACWRWHVGKVLVTLQPSRTFYLLFSLSFQSPCPF